MVDLSCIAQKDLWYFIGFLTADGSLSKDGRHIDITTKDRDVIYKLRKCLLLKNKVRRKKGGYAGTYAYNLQFGSVVLYRFLLDIGLIPNKSLTLGELRIPRNYFHDFLRGLIDGDGSIKTWVHSTNGNVQWCIKIYSAAPKFRKWLRHEIESHFRVKGHIGNVNGRVQAVTFGKFASKVILKKCYYKGCVALNRKLKKAQLCIQSENKLSKYGKVVDDFARVA